MKDVAIMPLTLTCRN